MKTIITLVIAVILYSCSTTKHIKNKVDWADDIRNPDNEEFVLEVAFNLEIPKDKVTQVDFNKRYLTDKIMEGIKLPAQSGQPNEGTPVDISKIVPDGTKR